MTKKHLFAVTLASLLAIPAIATAEDKMGCNDVNWGAEVTEQTHALVARIANGQQQTIASRSIQ